MKQCCGDSEAIKEWTPYSNCISKIIPWFICLLGALFYSYEYVLRILPSVMTPELMQHYAINSVTMGSLAGVYYWAYTPLQLPVGVLMDRFGPRRLLTIACILCVIGSYYFVATDSTLIAMIGRFIVGFGSAFAFVGVLKLATIWLAPDRLGMVAGLAAALGKVGGIFGVNVLTFLVAKHGWYDTSIYACFTGIILTVILWVFIRDSGELAVDSHVNEVIDFKLLIKDVAVICKNKQLWINGAVGCLIYLPTTVFGELWGYRYLEQAHGFAPKTAALGITALYLGFAIGAPIMGYVSDRLHNRRMPMLVGALLTSLFFAVMVYVPGLSEDVIFALLFAMGLSYGAQAIVFAVAREISPPEASCTAIAITNMIVMLAPAFLQPAVGFLLDFHANPLVSSTYTNTVGDYQFAFAAIVFGMLSAAVFAYFLVETHAKPKEYKAFHPE